MFRLDSSRVGSNETVLRGINKIIIVGRTDRPPKRSPRITA